MIKTHAAALAVFLVLPHPAVAQILDPAATTAQREEEEIDPSTERRDEWRLFLSSGLFFATGDYGTDIRTRSYVVPLTARVRKGPFRLSATLPYIRIDGSTQVIPGEDGPIVEEPTFERELREGFGDLNVRARYRLPKHRLAGFEVDLLGRVKLPTGSERKRLSTGEVDYSFGAEISRQIGSLEPFVEVEYRINGDPPDRDYKNTFSTSVGASTRFGRSMFRVAYDYSQSRVRGRKGSHSIDAFVGTPVSRRLLLGGFASVGLSERAPDFSIGSVLTARVF